MLHSLFWRTFGLIVLLLAASLLTWMQLQHSAQEQPRIARFAAEASSLVHLTRAGLLAASETERALLLDLLDQDEGIRVIAAERDDKILPWDDSIRGRALTRALQARVPDTQIAREVNNLPGLWIGFDIDGDRYWLLLDPQRWERHQDRRVLGGWALIALALALGGALWISRIVHAPLRALALRLQDIALGRPGDPLPESGPRALRRVHRQFNQMAHELARIDEDRRVALAGISHDLRTPLTRLRLELELQPLSPEARDALQRDLELIEAQMGQFIEFARPEPSGPWERIDLSFWVAQAMAESPWDRDEPAPECKIEIAPRSQWAGPPQALVRLLHNLFSNAVRHGASPDGRARLELKAWAEGHGVVLDLRDHGPGVAAGDFDRLVRPFERGSAARTGAHGSGLGLAIVTQIARRYGGGVRLSSPADGGLRIQVWLQHGPPPYKDALWRPTAIDRIN
jgi:two-component system osmolarity sensor histidine kinase EnvZ